MGNAPKDLQSKQRLQALEHMQRGLAPTPLKSTKEEEGPPKEAATLWLSLSLSFPAMQLSLSLPFGIRGQAHSLARVAKCPCAPK